MRPRHALLAPFALAAASALAAPGDTHVIDADLVNLRAGPSDRAEIRAEIARGSEVIELRRDGGWYGVRVRDTGQEGWIYGDLLERVASTTLGAPDEAAGFGELSPEFDALMRQVDERLGAPVVRDVAREGDRLTVTPAPEWLLSAPESAHVFAAMAIHQMWRAERPDGAVSVVLLDWTGKDYVVIEGEAGAPQLRVVQDASGSEGGG